MEIHILNKSFLPHIAILQVFGVLLVIIGHILSVYWATSISRDWYGFSINNFSYNYIYKFIYSFHMPLFFFISGYLFQYKNSNQKKFIDEVILRFRRLVIPYIFAGLLIYIPTVIFLAPSNSTINDFSQYLIQFFTLKNCAYLWFLPCLFVFLLFF